MRMPGRRNPRIEFDDGLDDLASGDTELVPLEIDACDSRLLRSRDVQDQTAGDHDRRHEHEWRGSPANPLVDHDAHSVPLLVICSARGDLEQTLDLPREAYACATTRPERLRMARLATLPAGPAASTIAVICGVHH